MMRCLLLISFLFSAQFLTAQNFYLRSLGGYGLALPSETMTTYEYDNKGNDPEEYVRAIPIKIASGFNWALSLGYDINSSWALEFGYNQANSSGQEIKNEVIRSNTSYEWETINMKHNGQWLDLGLRFNIPIKSYGTTDPIWAVGFAVGPTYYWGDITEEIESRNGLVNNNPSSYDEYNLTNETSSYKTFGLQGSLNLSYKFNSCIIAFAQARYVHNYFLPQFSEITHFRYNGDGSRFDLPRDVRETEFARDGRIKTFNRNGPGQAASQPINLTSIDFSLGITVVLNESFFAFW